MQPHDLGIWGPVSKFQASPVSAGKNDEIWVKEFGRTVPGSYPNMEITFKITCYRSNMTTITKKINQQKDKFKKVHSWANKKNLNTREKNTKSCSYQEKNYRFFIDIKQTVTGFSTINRKIRKHQEKKKEIQQQWAWKRNYLFSRIRLLGA